MTTDTAEGAAAWWRLDAGRWLLALSALLLAVALVDPGVSLERGRFDHIVVLDVTQSMNVTDQLIAGQPASRLDFAKQALRGALLKLPCGSKVGWAIFTEYRALLLFAPIEVCANLDELRSTLARIDSRMAWSGNSEIAKGLHSAVVIARELPEKPSLVFVTDGQEAPPINPRFRPAFDDKPGEVPGLIVGVGDLLPSPIPKRDPQGRPLGFWRADEVMQTDPRSQGRATSVPGEKMADGPGPADGVAAPMLGATPGREHLSALREGYLQLLAQEQGLGFLRLQTAQGLEAALMAPALAKPMPVRTGGRNALAALALGLLLLRYLLPWLRRPFMPCRRARRAAASPSGRAGT